MKDINLNGLNNIKADKELIEKTTYKVMNNNKSKYYFNVKSLSALVATLMVIVGSTSVYNLYNKGDLEKEIANSKVTSNKTANSIKLTPKKVIVDANIDPNTSVSNSDNVNPGNSIVGNNKLTPSRRIPDPNVLHDKAVLDNKSTFDKPSITDSTLNHDKLSILDSTLNHDKLSILDSTATVDKSSILDSTITHNKSSIINKNIIHDKSSIIDSTATIDKELSINNTILDSTLPHNKSSILDSSSTSNKTLVNANIVHIPPITLNTTDITNKISALVVYNDKIYTESNTQLDLKNIKKFLGQKIGRTINDLDKKNIEDKSSEKLASNIGEQDIYTVNGYDDSFRIMSYSKTESGESIQFFDCLNGITVKSGMDILGKLNLVGNIESAKFITFNDLNKGTNNYINFKDVDLLNEVSKDLNNAIPYNYETIEKDIADSKNNTSFREFTLKLKDSSEFKLTAFKKGYISYGNSNIYFKVEDSIIDKLWQTTKK